MLSSYRYYFYAVVMRACASPLKIPHLTGFYSSVHGCCVRETYFCKKTLPDGGCTIRSKFMIEKFFEIKLKSKKCDIILLCDFRAHIYVSNKIK
jgi:hypothetical protein